MKATRFLYLVLILIFISSRTTAGTTPTPKTLTSFNTVYNNAYDLIIPEQDHTAKLPLYIVLPGGIGKRYYPAFRNQFIAPSLQEKGIVFSPKLSWRHCSTKKLERVITSFIEVATKTMNVDPNKIILIGYSNGGMQSLTLAKRNQDLFSNVVLIASTFTIKSRINTPIHIIHGTNDRYFAIDKARRAAKKATVLGCEVSFAAAQGKTDFYASEYVTELSSFVDTL